MGELCLPLSTFSLTKYLPDSHSMEMGVNLNEPTSNTPPVGDEGPCAETQSSQSGAGGHLAVLLSTISPAQEAAGGKQGNVMWLLCCGCPL